MIARINHVGLSVVDLQRSIDFYRESFGMQVLAQAEFGGEQYEKILDLKEVKGMVALLGESGMQIELFEFSRPAPRPAEHDRPVCHHGITHFCVEVDDIDEMYERLKSIGAVFHCSPITFFGGARATYGRDPDGNVFELLKKGS